MIYDLLVIGQSREGIERAISVARTGRRVALVQTPDQTWSCDLMHAALNNLAKQGPVTLDRWKAEVARLTGCQRLEDDANLRRASVELFVGTVRFVSTREVELKNGAESQVVSSKEIMIACGTRSRQSTGLRTDGRFVVDLETLFSLPELPQTIVVVGAGETGLSAALMLATLGVQVQVIDEHASVLDVCGMSPHSFDATQSLNIAFRMNDEALAIQLQPDLQVHIRMASGRTIATDAVLICIGREGNTGDLNLDAAGVGVDESGRLWCDSNGRTWASSVTAAGDVIGFPRQRDRSVAFAL